MEDTREENHCKMCCEPKTSSDSTDWRRAGLLRDGPGMCVNVVNEFGRVSYGLCQGLFLDQTCRKGFSSRASF